LEMLMGIPRGIVTPADLRRAIASHLEQYKQVYGEVAFIPKCHYTLHLPDMFQRHGFLVSCWVHERKHKEIKRYGNALDNTHDNYELSIIENSLFVHFEALADETLLPKVSTC
jgi:hypothetical protein